MDHPVTQRPTADLELAISAAVKDYRATWQAVDMELYELCQRKPGQQTFDDVYPKVAIIGRVYVAGISRSSRASGDREAAVARGLVSLADMIEEALRDLAGRPFDRATTAQAVELHGRVTRGLRQHAGGVWLTSFVSKYLHFHSSTIPIYDSLAQQSIGRFVNWQAVTGVRASMADLPDWTRAYRNFAAAFAILHDRIGIETSVPATVKEIDHMLWHTSATR